MDLTGASVVERELRAIATGAADLVLSFFGNFIPSAAAQAGTKRRVKREDVRRERVAELYAQTPADTAPSRQQRRAQARAVAKAAARKAAGLGPRGTSARRQSAPNWRDMLRRAKAGES